MMDGIADVLRGFLRDVSQQRLIGAALANIGVKLGGVLVALLLHIVLTRVLDMSGYGQYAYVMAVVAVLSVPAVLGMPQYLVREAAGRLPQVVGLRFWADRRVVLAGVVCAILLLLFALLADGARRQLFALAAVLPLFGGLGAVRRALLQACGQAWKSQVAALVFVPAATLLGVLLLDMNGQVVLWQLMLVSVLAGCLPWLFNGVWLRSAVRGIDAVDVLGSTLSLRAAVNFMWLGGAYLLLSRTDLIMLGLLADGKSAAVYAVASRAADLVPLVLIAVNTVIAPRIASLHREGDREALQSLVGMAMRMILLASIPIVLVLFCAAPWLLGFVFGDVYAAGSSILRVLVLAQFILVLGGPLGTLLEMSGNERASLAIMIWIVALNIAINLILIPVWGAQGASVATCASVVLGRVLLWRQVRNKLLVRPSVFGS